MRVRVRAKIGLVHVANSDAGSTEATELALTANAYVESAEHLCTHLLAEEYEGSPHHCKVVLHLAYLGTELGFKAELCVTRGTYPRHHNLVELHRLYEETSPATPLRVPGFIDTLLPRLTGELFVDDPAPSATWQFARFRYATDSRGREFPELEIADLQALRSDLRELRIAINGLLIALGFFGRRFQASTDKM